MRKVKLKTDIGKAILFGVIAISLMGCGSEKNYIIKYKLESANYGKYGVIVLEMSHKIKKPINGLSVPAIANLNPKLPAETTLSSLGKFSNFEESIPGRAKVKWQLARLSNCDIVYKSPNYPNNVRKYGCDWTPIEGQVFTQELDMEAIRNSEAYQRAGDYVEGNPLAGTYTLRIVLIFNEDSLRVEARNGKTMGFMQ